MNLIRVFCFLESNKEKKKNIRKNYSLTFGSYKRSFEKKKKMLKVFVLPIFLKYIKTRKAWVGESAYL